MEVTGIRKEEKCLYEEWMNTQDNELKDLQKAIQLNTIPESQKLLIDKIMDNFQDYVDKRRQMVRKDAMVFYAPPWCNSLENSSLWIGGCRPSAYIRLLYALCGLNVESNLAEFLRTGENSTGGGLTNLSELSAQQMKSIDELHKRTIREERNLQDKYASLQEDVVDQPFARIAKVSDMSCESNSRETEESLGEHEKAMASLLVDADLLRMNTTKEIISILNPIQAMNFLAAGKKIRHCIREWGTNSDRVRSCSDG